MHGCHFYPNALLLLLIVLVFGIAIADRGYFHFDGHVLCSIENGTAEVPVRNAEVKLMEKDCLFFTNLTQYYALHFCLNLSVCWFNLFDCDEQLAGGRTDAEGAFSLDGSSSEFFGSTEPYLAIIACHNEISCVVKKLMYSEREAYVERHKYFMDEEFCQHCEAGGECQSAEWEVHA
jgi:hypothetical protein